MKIKINSNFGLSNYCGNEIETNSGMTIRDLLTNIGEKLNFSFFNSETGDIHREMQIIINGKDYLLLPTQLETSLKEGDSVNIYFFPLGGG